MMSRLFFLISLILFSCNESVDNSLIQINIQGIQMKVPDHWELIKLKGIDSSIGLIVIKEGNDTLFYDKGYYSNNLAESNLRVLSNEAKAYIKDTTDIVFVPSEILEQGIDIDKYRKQNILFNTVNNVLLKITIPRTPENGFTGVYIDSVGNDNLGRIKFNLYGNNLKYGNQKDLLKAISTIKIEQVKTN